MKKRFCAILLVVFCAFLGVRPAFGCRFNVRETGFVDLGMEPYVLCGYVDGNTPAEVRSEFRRISDSALAESNIIFRLIDADREKEHPALKYLDPNSQSFPCAVLVSPDGQTLNVSISKDGAPFEKTLSSALDKVVSSPKRGELLEQVSKMYGVIMVLEGPDAEANAKAKKGALAAIEQVTSQMDFMPKEILHPPALVMMDSKSIASEKVLLWSLGLEAKDVNEPLAIIVYGRGRWIGPLFRGGQVNEDDLASILFVVGADCECGLDYRWLQGTMLPAKWDEKLHQRAVDSLGFDPESPMIKMEIGSIIGRGLGGGGYPSTPYGYQELIIEPEVEVDEPPMESVEEQNVVSAETDEPMAVEEAVAEEREDVVADVAKADDARSIGEANVVAVEKPEVGMVDPNAIRAMLREEASGGGGDDNIFKSMRSTAAITLGLLAFVVIFGGVILGRARRL